MPDSPTHKQVAPPPDFHRDPVTTNKPIGIFENQTDVGAALVPGDASYDAADNSYIITSAGYNIWYTRDEFRYLWKKMSGDVSLAATITFPDPNGFGDRKAALVIRQGLNDDAVEALVAQHGAGMVHLARREVENTRIKDMEYRVGSRGGLPGGATPDSLVTFACQPHRHREEGRCVPALGQAGRASPCIRKARPLRSICRSLSMWGSALPHIWRRRCRPQSWAMWCW